MTKPVDLEQQLKDERSEALRAVAFSHGTMFRGIAELHLGDVGRKLATASNQTDTSSG